MPGNGVGHLSIQFRESISRFAPDVVTLVPGAGGTRADWARKKIGYSGVHYVPTWLGRRSALCSLIEKNLVVSLRQIRALSDHGKLTFEPHELRALSQEFQNKLRDLVTECQSRVPIVVLLTREYRIQRSQGRLAQIWSAGSRLFYEPYMSVGAFMDVNDEFNRVRCEVAAQTGALLVDIAGLLPPDQRVFRGQQPLHALGKRGHRRARPAAPWARTRVSSDCLRHRMPDRFMRTPAGIARVRRGSGRGVSLAAAGHAREAALLRRPRLGAGLRPKQPLPDFRHAVRG